MSDCPNSANSQLKAMQARLNRIDDDLIAHYAGISELVAGLAANPITAPSVATSLRTYNFNAAGHTLLKKLVGLIPGVSQFKSLQHIDSAALIDGMATQAATAANAAVIQMADQLTAAVTAHADAIAAQVVAAANTARAISQGISGADLIAIKAAETAADNLVASAAGRLASVNQLVGVLNGFMQTCTDIASCKTRSSIVG